MEQITKYKAIDGTEFSSSTECLQYEELIARVDKIMAQLPERPNLSGCEFENGAGYLQHDKETLLYVKKALLDVIGEKIDHKWIAQSKTDDSIHSSWVGRLLSDYNIMPLDKAWYRFSCIDKEGREWGQPYYANNPDQANSVRLN